MSHRRWAVDVGVPLSTLYLSMKHDRVKAVRRWIKSILSEKAKVTRVESVLGHMSRKGGTGMAVDDMYKLVHVDEKWFDFMRDRARKYLRPDEELPNPPRSPSKHLSARSCFLQLWLGPDSYPIRSGFDGKICIWPVIEPVKTESSSKNHAAGDIETKPVTMDREQHKQMMMKEVIPAIKARTPGVSTRTIWVQQDGTNPHARNGVIAAIEAAAGENFKLETQPPNSPDLNILDLGFFHPI
ncbi:unnamed protein product [Discosporangium mesarthrocarpum]